MRNFTVVHVYPFFNRLGGIEKYLLDTLPHQKKAHDLLLMGGEFEEDVARDYATLKVPFLARPRFLVSISFSMSAQRALGKLRRQGRIHPGACLTHAQGASCFRQDIVTAHSCHKAWFLRSLREQTPFSWPWFRKLLNPVHYLTIAIESIQYRPRNHKRIIAISNCIKSELVDNFGISAGRISVVHSGVDCETYDPRLRDAFRTPIRTRHGIPEDVKLLCLVANEFRRKGLEVVLRAMAAAANPRIQLVVVGRDDPAPFRSLISNLGLSSRVHFAGSVRGVNEYYAAADIFVLPTLYEPFGLVITEAMAAGLPVIVSKLAGAAEIMEPGRDGVLLDDPHDSIELARAIDSLAAPEIRDRMGRQARETALRHQWHDVVAQVSAVYRQVIEHD
jgi:UDP-glucose:(heptosyl)LPS alpha-1,3-glucosyltransferase